MTRLSQPARGHLAMLLFSALVAGSFSLGRMAAPHVDPAVLNAVRFAIAAAVMWAVAFAAGGVPRSIRTAPWRYAVLAGLFCFYFVTMFEGLKTAAPVGMAAVFTLTPALTAGFGWLVLRQVTTPRMAAGIAVGGVGALWVIFDGSAAAAAAFRVERGEALYFWGCVAHALYAPLVARFNRGEPAAAFTAAVLTAGAAMLILWAPGRLWQTAWTGLPPIVWITILYTALAATALSFSCIRYAALRLPSAKVMAYTYLVPSWVILWEIALGRGTPPALVLPGLALTAAALLVLLRDESRGKGSAAGPG